MLIKRKKKLSGKHPGKIMMSSGREKFLSGIARQVVIRRLARDLVNLLSIAKLEKTNGQEF